MKKNDFAEVKKLDIKTLQQRVKKLREEIMDLSFDKKTGKLKNSKSIKIKRRDLAQILTVTSQKELISELEENNAKK